MTALQDGASSSVSFSCKERFFLETFGHTSQWPHSSPSHRINSVKSTVVAVIKVIANNDYAITDTNDFMEVMEDEVSREEKAVTPKRVRNPRIEVEVIWRGRVVCNHGRTFPVVVIVDHRLLSVLRTCI